VIYLCEVCKTNKIDEILYRDIKNRAARSKFKTVERASILKSFYTGLNIHGDLTFKTTSATTPGKDFWYQIIRLKDLKVRSQVKDLSDKEFVNLILYGDLQVYCDDPSFLYYGWKYMAYNRDYGIRKEIRYPHIRNPRLSGAVCKHIYSVLTVLPFNINKITRDLKKRGVLNV
jgi:hypothetical protein